MRLGELIPKDWHHLLEPLLCDEKTRLLEMQLQEEWDKYPNEIAPAQEHIFRALQETPLDQVRVVILGQDPYQTPGLAQGLAFSIPKEIRPGWKTFPSSLRNISKALVLDGFPGLAHGDLQSWANQGVLLLNATLTVRLHQAASHASLGWQDFTDQLIDRLATKRHGLIWLLWGAHAQKKEALILQADREAVILRASHPSGLSVYKTDQPFIYPGDRVSCAHFKQVNELLSERGQAPISWS